MGYMTLRQVASVLGAPMREQNGDYDFPCPFCVERESDHVGTLHINPSKEKAICHTCGWSTSSMLYLLRQIGADLKIRVGSIKELESFADDLRKPALREPDEELTLPKEFRSLRKNKSTLADIHRTYLRRRHVTEPQIRKHNLGYCAGGPYEGYTVIPVYNYGDLAYFTTRRVIGGRGLKQHHPKYPIGRTIFNIDGAVSNKHGVITEAVFDAMTFRSRGVAVFNHHISAHQLSHIADLAGKVSEWTVCFDGDSTKHTYNAAFDIHMMGIADVSVIELPEDADPNELGPAACKKLLGDRKPFKLTKRVLAMLSTSRRGRIK